MNATKISIILDYIAIDQTNVIYYILLLIKYSSLTTNYEYELLGKDIFDNKKQLAIIFIA